MTAMLASVAGPEEAEVALAGGADIIDLKDPRAGALGALPLDRVRDTVAAVAGRRPTSAVAGDLPLEPAAASAAVEAMAATGVDFVKLGLRPGDARRDVVRALSGPGLRAKLVAVLFADCEADFSQILFDLAAAGFAGAMLDTADKAGGRLLAHADVPALTAFVRAARGRGLMVGLAGSLEAPDVPRLLALEPDFLGFRGALCRAGERRGGVELAAVQAIRALIPPDAALPRPENVDYRLLAARGWHPGAPEDGAADRIFVRDFVLPVRIGAYSHERAAPQRVRFDVSVEVARSRGEPPRPAAGLAQVFSYDLITDAIRALVADGHVDLVETLADRIAAKILAHPRARRVTVRVEKLDMGPGGVGVEITAERPDAAAGQNPVLAMLEDAGRGQ